MCFAWEPYFCSERRKKNFTTNVFEVVQNIFWKPTRKLNIFDYSVSTCRTKYDSLVAIRRAICFHVIHMSRHG